MTPNTVTNRSLRTFLNAHAILHVLTIALVIVTLFEPSWRVYLLPIIGALGGGGFTSIMAAIKTTQKP